MAETNPNKYKISVWDFMVLLNNYVRRKDLAELSADTTYHKVAIEATQLYFEVSSALYHELLYVSNLASEEQSFWHPENKTFDQFLKLALRSSYDKKYGIIRRNNGSK